MTENEKAHLLWESQKSTFSKGPPRQMSKTDVATERSNESMESTKEFVKEYYKRYGMSNFQDPTKQLESTHQDVSPVILADEPLLPTQLLSIDNMRNERMDRAFMRNFRQQQTMAERSNDVVNKYLLKKKFMWMNKAIGQIERSFHVNSNLSGL
jgi:hypothetical protein